MQLLKLPAETSAIKLVFDIRYVIVNVAVLLLTTCTSLIQWYDVLQEFILYGVDINKLISSILTKWFSLSKDYKVPEEI